MISPCCNAQWQSPPVVYRPVDAPEDYDGSGLIFFGVAECCPGG